MFFHVIDRNIVGLIEAFSRQTDLVQVLFQPISGFVWLQAARSSSCSCCCCCHVERACDLVPIQQSLANLVNKTFSYVCTRVGEPRHFKSGNSEGKSSANDGLNDVV